jgi:hypothetical protein
MGASSSKVSIVIAWTATCLRKIMGLVCNHPNLSHLRLVRQGVNNNGSWIQLITSLDLAASGVTVGEDVALAIEAHAASGSALGPRNWRDKMDNRQAPGQMRTCARPSS